mgnify:CR=1 FL=1
MVRLIQLSSIVLFAYSANCLTQNSIEEIIITSSRVPMPIRQIGLENRILFSVTSKKVIRLVPPLIIDQAQADLFVDQLDRDDKDFSIEVTSSGVGNPLKNSRQFLKNIGRKLKVELLNGSSIQGVLDAADDFGFTLKWKQREPKPIGKGKRTVEKKEKLSYNEVIKTIVLV